MSENAKENPSLEGDPKAARPGVDAGSGTPVSWQEKVGRVDLGARPVKDGVLENKTTTQPPEREFDDGLTPEEQKKFSLKESWARPQVKWFVGIGGPVILGIVLFFSHGSSGSKTQVPIRPEESPQMITGAAMDRAIAAAGKDDKKTKALEGVRKPLPVKKRNYATEIAVYVEPPIKAESSGARVQETRAQQKLLGLPSGTKIPARLSNRIFSFNVAAPVIAQVIRDFKWQENIVIPRDSKFLGEASVLKTLDRINVKFETLIFPDGRELRVRAMALSEDGSGGIKGKVDKHRDMKTLKAIGETLLGGASLFVGGAGQGPYNLEDQLRVNLATSLTGQAAQDLRSVKTEESVTVETDTSIQVILLEAT
ncbi:MAG: TrbI/VirB10 family protein [Candidatus Omnitrophota bacterium]